MLKFSKASNKNQLRNPNEFVELSTNKQKLQQLGK